MMRKNVRVLSLILAFLTLLSAVVSCGSKGESAKNAELSTDSISETEKETETEAETAKPRAAVDFSSLPHRIHSGAYPSGHCQGIAVDLEKGFIYFSFTTLLVKTDLKGNFIGSVTGLYGHLGCIAFNYEDGKVYGSLEFLNDEIGDTVKRVLGMDMTLPDSFYLSIFDVDKIDRADIPSEEVMRCAYLKEVTDDYLAEVTLEDGRTVSHKYGCAGVDGTAIGPDFGAGKNGKNWLFLAYGVYADNTRDDNDYQVILKYDIREMNEKSEVLHIEDLHQTGPEAPASKYFVYTGNTTYGVQNLEYDPYTETYFMCVYPGNKPAFPNPATFAADATKAPVWEKLIGVYPETHGDVLSLDEHGLDGMSFDKGGTGFAALGDGWYYASHSGQNSKNQELTAVRLYRLSENGELELAK